MGEYIYQCIWRVSQETERDSQEWNVQDYIRCHADSNKDVWSSLTKHKSLNPNISTDMCLNALRYQDEFNKHVWRGLATTKY